MTLPQKAEQNDSSRIDYAPAKYFGALARPPEPDTLEDDKCSPAEAEHYNHTDPNITPDLGPESNPNWPSAEDYAELARLAELADHVRTEHTCTPELPPWPDAGESPELEHEELRPKQSLEPNGVASLGIFSISDLPSIWTYAAHDISYVVEGLIVAGTVTMISGESGCGKSTLVTAMAGSIARGVPFAGMETKRKPVLILDKENPISIVCDRLKRLSVRDSMHLNIWGGWVKDEHPRPPFEIVAAWVEGCDPKPLIIIDSLISFSEGDENKASDVRTYMQAYRRLADRGATIVLLHNSGKGESSKSYRGSSDIKASVDVAYTLSNAGDYRLTKLELSAFKMRFTVEPELTFDYNDGKFNRPRKIMTEELLQTLLIEHPGISTAEFENKALSKEVKRGPARTFLASGTGNGSIQVKKGDKNSNLHTWVGHRKSQ